MDCSATTPIAPEVLEEMMPYMTARFGNPSSTHDLGREAKAGLELARSRMAALINASPDEIVFTSGGTEANNQVLIGCIHAMRSGPCHVITSKIEHQSILAACRYLESLGTEVSYLSVDEAGIINPADVARAIRPHTALISVMHANNEIGTIQPIQEIAEIAGERKVPFHTDAIQTAGKIPVDVKAMRCDYVSVSAHKFYGPKGIGCLYIKKGVDCEALLHGGRQENGLRAGTENTAGIIGMGAAARLALKEMENDYRRLRAMADSLIAGIQETIAGCHLNGHRFHRLPGHISVSFTDISGTDILKRLNQANIAASSGSACHAADPKPSHVLKAMDYPDDLAKSTLRFSLGRYSKEEDIAYLLDILPGMIENCRGEWLNERSRAVRSGGENSPAWPLESE